MASDLIRARRMELTPRASRIVRSIEGKRVLIGLEEFGKFSLEEFKLETMHSDAMIMLLVLFLKFSSIISTIAMFALIRIM